MIDAAVSDASWTLLAVTVYRAATIALDYYAAATELSAGLYAATDACATPPAGGNCSLACGTAALLVAQLAAAAAAGQLQRPADRLAAGQLAAAVLERFDDAAGAFRPGACADVGVWQGPAELQPLYATTLPPAQSLGQKLV